jgi:hypothetical protein
VLAVWDHNTLLEEFKSGSGGFFILTNSRDLPTLEARKLIATICHAVKEAARASNREFEIVLRATQLCVAISLMSQRWETHDQRRTLRFEPRLQIGPGYPDSVRERCNLWLQEFESQELRGGEVKGEHRSGSGAFYIS